MGLRERTKPKKGDDIYRLLSGLGPPVPPICDWLVSSHLLIESKHLSSVPFLIKLNIPQGSAQLVLVLEICPTHPGTHVVQLHLVSFFLPSFLFFDSTRAWTQGLHLEPLHQPFLCYVFSKHGLMNYLPTIASNQDPPDLCLLSSKYYLCELTAPDTSYFGETLVISLRRLLLLTPL
jgi:hypothetical protein